MKHSEFIGKNILVGLSWGDYEDNLLAQQLIAHPTPIVLAALITGGYGICKTVKAIKAESEK